MADAPLRLAKLAKEQSDALVRCVLLGKEGRVFDVFDGVVVGHDFLLYV